MRPRSCAFLTRSPNAACQSADWANHKDVCREHSLRDAQWVSIEMSSLPISPRRLGMADSGKDWHAATLNKYSNINLGFSDKTSAANKLDPSNAPPNEHADRLFLIKLQGGLPGMGPPGHFMIYDRKRTFQTFMQRDSDPARFVAVLTEMTASPRTKYDGCKMYRWAKRTGDWELSLCLDREPKPDMCRW